MADNVSLSGRTKHLDVRYHYVRELIEDGFIKIISVRSEDNFADGFTKNVSGSIYDAHITEFMAEHEAMANN
jgi:hypothetical protein